MRSVRFLFLFLACVASLAAQRVRWSDAGTGDPADLQLVFEDCKPAAKPALPDVPGVTFTYRGQSTQTSIINFSRTDSVILSYRLQIRTPGSVEIPAFAVSTDHGAITVPAYATGTVRPSPERDIKARLQAGETTVWAGEVFPLTYSIDVARRSFSNFGDQIEWEASPLLAEDWSKPAAAESSRNGESRLNILFRTRAYAKAPGTVKPQPVRQLLNLALGTVGFGLFQQQRIEQVAVTTDRPEIRVQPLPAPAPASFTGAVGQFKLESKVVPTTAAVGEPITWTLTLAGSGNWPDLAGLPPRSVSKDFQIVQPQAKRTMEEGKLFDGTLSEDVVLVPTKPGTYTLGPVEFTTFNPQTGTYETARTPATTITVTATAAAPRFNITPTTEPTADEAPAPTAPAAAKNPLGIPRDPLAGAAVTARPFAARDTLVAAALAPLALLLIAWLGLAWHRARERDPQRPRREARRELIALLADLQRAEPAPIASLLLRWQHAAARLWSLRHAAPAAPALPNDAWRTLWLESERALYGDNVALPSDWVARAQAAVVAVKVPGTAWWRALQPRHLLPFFFALTLAFAAPRTNAATDPAVAYAQGDFAAAEKTWRAAVTAAPTDWIARHNLSLALAQQDRWGEAAAQATAAFVQSPADARWNLSLAYGKAGYTPNAVAPLLASAPRADLARLASPAGWERWLIIGSALGAAALLALLLRAYGHGPRWLRWPAFAGLALGIAVAATAVTGRAAYGVAAERNAVIVWRGGTLYSIPTEADTAQQTTPLAPGAMGTADKTFLGWVRLTFPNGQTGWVRETEIVALYR
ncbi:MAG: BatD family protein [Cephaloticoccus sp.]